MQMRLPWRLGGWRFIKSGAIRMWRILMKPASIKGFVGVDRIATRGEIRFAMSLLSQGAFGLGSACDDFREAESDSSDRTCNLREDTMWLVLVREMPDSQSN
jgi:hypothetical protein